MEKLHYMDGQYFVQPNIFEYIKIDKIQINLKNKSPLPLLLYWLKIIFITKQLNKEFYSILKKQSKDFNQTMEPLTDMYLWQLFVLNMVKDAMRLDHHTLQNLANHHQQLQGILGIKRKINISNRDYFKFDSLYHDINLITLPPLKRLFILTKNKLEPKFKFINVLKSTEEQYTMSQIDICFINKLTEVIDENFNSQFMNNAFLARSLFISERQLFRRVKRLTGMTPSQFTNNIKLLKAYEYIENNPFSKITEVASHVGFKDAHYFSKFFKKHFSKSINEVLSIAKFKTMQKKFIVRDNK